MGAGSAIRMASAGPSAPRPPAQPAASDGRRSLGCGRHDLGFDPPQRPLVHDLARPGVINDIAVGGRIQLFSVFEPYLIRFFEYEAFLNRRSRNQPWIGWIRLS